MEGEKSKDFVVCEVYNAHVQIQKATNRIYRLKGVPAFFDAYVMAKFEVVVVVSVVSNRRRLFALGLCSLQDRVQYVRAGKNPSFRRFNKKENRSRNEV